MVVGAHFCFGCGGSSGVRSIIALSDCSRIVVAILEHSEWPQYWVHLAFFFRQLQLPDLHPALHLQKTSMPGAVDCFWAATCKEIIVFGASSRSSLRVPSSVLAIGFKSLVMYFHSRTPYAVWSSYLLSWWMSIIWHSILKASSTAQL